MTDTVAIYPHGQGAAVVGQGWVRDFQNYLSATKAAGCKYKSSGGKKFQKLENLDEIGKLMTCLKDHGIKAAIDPEIQGHLDSIAQKAQAQVDHARKQVLQAQERVAVMESDLAGRGLSLYDFQKDGVEWLALRGNAGLFDDQGLGKTVQAIVAMPLGGRVVVVCGSTLKYLWQDEIEKWAPHLKTTVLGGEGSFRWPDQNEVIIINDNVLPLSEGCVEGDADYFCELPDGPVQIIYDEAQRGKGGKATQRGRRFLNLRDLTWARDGGVWLLTGTPLINRPQELRKVLEMAGLFEEAFGTWAKMVKMFNGKRVGSTWVWGLDDAGNVAMTDAAAEALKKVSLRRIKRDVLPDLPGKTRQKIRVGMTDESLRRTCDELLYAAQRELEEAKAKQKKRAAEAVDNLEELEEQKKLPSADDLGKVIQWAMGQPVMFNTMSRVRKLLASAKIDAMMDVVKMNEDDGEPLVVFSCHREPINILERREGWAAIHGDIKAEERNEIVKRFQAGELRGIACTSGPGGTGITLTRSCRVLFVDLDWTPAGNVQAEDRLVRIGQTRGVLITTLVIDHALEARIFELLEEKQRIIDGSVNRSAVKKGKDVAAILEAMDAEVAAITDLTAEAVAMTEEAQQGVPGTKQIAVCGIPITVKVNVGTRSVFRGPKNAAEEEAAAFAIYYGEGDDASFYGKKRCNDLKSYGRLTDQDWDRICREAKGEGAESQTIQEEVEPGFYQYGKDYYKVQENRDGTNCYCKKLDENGKWQYEGKMPMAFLRDEHKLTLEEACRLGKLYGSCVICSRKLTDEESISLGMGKICAGKF